MKSESEELRWEERMRELRAFQGRFGHCFVPQRWAENRKLGNWVEAQRRRKRRGQLSEEQSRRLEEIGFAWSGKGPNRPRRASQWESRFEELVAWKAAHGDFRVSAAENAGLAEWMEHQRKGWRQRKLGEERFERLNSIGFPWEAEDPVWEERLAQLREYRKRYGNCEAVGWQARRGMAPWWPEEDEREMAALGSWVQAQRSLRRRGQLSAERIRPLDELGFKWNGHGRRDWSASGQWLEMFKWLQEFHREHGHFRVTEDPARMPGLHRWVLRQRECWRKGKLEPLRVRLLKGIGFPLEQAEEPRWEQRYAELKVYQERHGNCNVPSHWAENKALATWVMKQRRRKRLGRLSGEQIERLNGLGFEWRD